LLNHRLSRIELALRPGGRKQTLYAEEPEMKLAAQFLMVAATAGLAVLAVTNRKPIDQKKDDPAPTQQETDAWFI
jgi:hypothetical protein